MLAKKYRSAVLPTPQHLIINKIINNS